jgi:hypothetical protein
MFHLGQEDRIKPDPDDGAEVVVQTPRRSWVHAHEPKRRDWSARLADGDGDALPSRILLSWWYTVLQVEDDGVGVRAERLIEHMLALPGGEEEGP